MKMIVGLGNPGKEYEMTKHNIGFYFLDNYAKKYNTTIEKVKGKGLYTEILVNGEKIILLKPQSYMNLSGEVVKYFVDYFKINISDILIINDDLDLPFGHIKLKEKGSSGGHNGLKNIELHLKTPDYKRLKVGISNNKAIDTKDYVLGKFNQEEREILANLISEINNILDDFLMLDFNKLMSKYNSKKSQ